MRGVVGHFAQHPSHVLGCVGAAVLVATAIVLSLPVLAAFGALLCASMMVMMVWMMVSMASKHRD